jgi:hypothetical protein
MEPWRVCRPVLQILITVIKIWILDRRILSLKGLKGAVETHPDEGLKMEPWRVSWPVLQILIRIPNPIKKPRSGFVSWQKV